MTDPERLIRKSRLGSCCSEQERLLLEDRYKVLDRGRWQGVIISCVIFIPVIMALSYALVHY